MHSFGSHQDSEFFLLLRTNGIVVIEPPAGGRESILRIFMTSADALFYREDTRPNNTIVRRTSLPDLWSLLGHINISSLQQYLVPVRVELSHYRNGEVEAVEILHSVFRPPN